MNRRLFLSTGCAALLAAGAAHARRSGDRGARGTRISRGTTRGPRQPRGARRVTVRGLWAIGIVLVLDGTGEQCETLAHDGRGNTICSGLSHERRIEGIEGQVLEPVFGDQHLVLQLDAEIPVLLADQRLDTQRHARLQHVVERALHEMIGIGDERPLVAQADPVEAAGILARVVFRVELMAPKVSSRKDTPGASNALLTMICSCAWRIASTMSGRGGSGPSHQVRLMSMQMP
jgi:hypothetical protein